MTAEKQLERLMNEYGDAIFRMCYLYLKDYHLAEDAVQETFIKVMKAYNTFQHRSSEKTWIIRIAIQRLNRARKKLKTILMEAGYDEE